jgi:hypothetical protein
MLIVVIALPLRLPKSVHARSCLERLRLYCSLCQWPLHKFCLSPSQVSGSYRAAAKAWVQRAYPRSATSSSDGVGSVWQRPSLESTNSLQFVLPILVIHYVTLSPDGSDGSARRTRHARRQGMGPTCLFRRSHGLWNGVVSVLWRSASGHFSILMLHTLCLLFFEAKRVYCAVTKNSSFHAKLTCKTNLCMLLARFYGVRLGATRSEHARRTSRLSRLWLCKRMYRSVQTSLY